MMTRSRQRGFTLLEVLVAVAILGLGLTAILSAQAGAFQSAAHSRNISLATGLLRCKVAEVEEHLYKEGFQETDETGSGPCCEGDETPNMKCTWRVDKPQFPEAKFGQLDLNAGLNLGGTGSSSGAGALGALGLLAGPGATSPLAGASGIGDVAKTLADANAQAVSGAAGAAPPPSSDSSSGMPGGADAAGMGGLASMAMSFVYPGLKLLFEASTRRIVATVIFREGTKERSIEVTEWFTIPQKGLAVDDQSAQDTDPTSSSSGGSKSSSSGKSSSGSSGKSSSGSSGRAN